MNNNRRKSLCELEGRLLKLSEEQLSDLKYIIEIIQAEEKESFENLPSGIQESERGVHMEETIDALDDALDNIQSAFAEIGSAIENVQAAYK